MCGRCRAAGLGEDTVFATKPELAARMIGRFLDAGHRVGWVAGDEFYGGNPKLQSALVADPGAPGRTPRHRRLAALMLPAPGPSSRPDRPRINRDDVTSWRT